MATTVDNYKIKITVEGREGLKNLKKDMEDVGTYGGPLGNTINGIINKLGPLGLAAGVAGAAFAALGGRALSLAGELSDIAGATGIAAGTLMNFRQSVVEAGGKADDFAQIAAKLNQSVQEAASGNEKLQDAFRNLGVYVTDAGGKVRSTEAILQDIVDKFRGGEITASQYSAAIDILGKNINKLELGKLSAAADPVKDEQIRQLDKYNDALDKLAETINNKLITAFGKMAMGINQVFEDISKTIRAQEELDKKLAESGKAQVMPGVTGTIRGLLGLPPRTTEPLITRNLSEEEKRQAQLNKQIEANAANHANEMQRLQNRGAAAQGGGFGATPESIIKAREASAKRIADSEIELNKQTQLQVNSERLNAIMMFADKQTAIEQRAESQIRELRINSAAEIDKARLDIFAQEKLTQQEKEAELAQKTLEINAKLANDITRIRGQSSEQLLREAERIQDIITQSKARVTEEESVNEVIAKRNKFFLDNATLTDKERQRAQDLFDLEEERLKVLRQIALIKDIPPEERAKREAEINEIYKNRRQLTLEQQDADRSLQQNFAAGFERAYNQYLEDSKNAFETAGRLFKTVTQGIEDAIVQSTKTGKFAWKDMVSSMVEELLRSQIRQLLAGIVGSGNLLGGSSNFFSSLLGFANGGVIPTNRPVIVGEKGPELLIGASGGRVIPNNQLGGGSVTYNINAVDASSFKSLIARDPAFIHAVAMQGAQSMPGRR